MIRLILISIHCFHLLTIVTSLSPSSSSLSSSLHRCHRLKDTKRNPESGSYDFSYWSKAFISQPNEFSYTINDIIGTIPTDLTGSLYRAMPGLFERGNKQYGHYLDGDGYIIKLTIGDNGSVSFKSKYVKTKEYQEEQAAGKVLYRSTFRTQRDSNIIANTICLNNAFDLKLKNGANTNVIYWNDSLRVLFEAGVPHQLDPITLDTIGEDDLNLGKQLKSGMSVLVPQLKDMFPDLHDSLFGASMTAHPKIVEDRLIGWTWRAKVGSSPLDTQPQMYFHEWDSNMKKIMPTTTHTLTSTTVSPHDFSITENYYVLIENRVEGNTIPYILGTKCPADCVSIVPSKEMILNIVSRPKKSNNIDKDEEGTFKTIPLTPGFTIHSVCSWEEGSKLTLLTTAWDTETVRSGKVKGGLLGAWEGAAPKFDVIPVTLLYKTVIDTSTGRLISHAPQERMEKIIVEHPHINPDYESKKVRYVWMSMGSIEGISSPPLGYLRLDLETGKIQKWFAPLHHYCEELVIVTKSLAPNSSKNNEDDVYLIATIFDATINKSRFVIFDGIDVEKGPITEIVLSHHLPHSLHGCFTKSIIQ